MDITYLGHSSFRIKGKQAVVVTDPYDEKTGKFPKGVEADVVTVSHDHADHNQTQLVGGSPFLVNGPGEYEIKGVSVIGVPTWHDDKEGAERGGNTLYVIEMEGLRIVHAGDLGHKLTEQQLQAIGGEVDVAIIPVGGVYTIDPKQAVEVVKQLDPWVIIPMHYQTVDDFLKEMGKSVLPVPKLSISRDRLPEETQLVVLEG